MDEPTHTTPRRSPRQLAASWMLDRRRQQQCICPQRTGSAYPNAVFPAPGGPQISVTWPFWIPPCSAPSNPERSEASRAGRPVGMQPLPSPSRSCRACAADTVGKRSWRGSQWSRIEAARSWEKAYASMTDQNLRRRGRGLHGSPSCSITPCFHGRVWGCVPGGAF